MKCACGYGEPHEDTVRHYDPEITWKRGPVPKVCRECEDTIGYHTPRCIRPPAEYESGDDW